jgi:hypothetical protein
MLPRLRALLFATTLCSAPFAALAQTTVVGNWQGSMKVNGKDLHLVFHIHQATDGRYDALLDSLDQDAAGIPVTTVSFTGSTLRLEISQVSATYVGNLSKDGKELKGVWSEGKDHHLTLKRLADSAELERPVPIGGDWMGSIDEGGKQKAVYLHINATNGDTLKGTLDIPESSINAAFLPNVSFRHGTLNFSVDSLRLSYSGKLNDEGYKFEGVWKEGHSVPVTFTRATHPFRTYVRPPGCKADGS